ncbi:MAG: putative Ig domain-containing protein [Caldilineaceae bacterium]|nr:putative Ig domain-containing protein [Caldilineaceae bacterium]
MNEHNTETKTLHWRKEFLIGSLIGLCVMLLALLAVVVSPRPRTAQAQSDSPRVAISVGDSTMNQGDVTWVHASFHNMPQDPNDDKAFGVYFRYYFDRNSDGTWTNADGCAENLVGGDLYITTWYRSPWDHGASPFAITTTCQVGDYRIRVSVKDKTTHTEVVSGTHDITVSLGPSVNIAMPSTSYYRGSALNPTINFNNLVQGADYTYKAFLMARNPPNYADICEGTGLDRNNTFALNAVSGNPVQKTVTITDDCPTNEYKIEVKLYDSDDRKRGSDVKEFEITTDPNATPSVTVSLSEPSPIAPGTEFEVIFKFYDIQPGTAVVSLDTMTNTSTNQAVGEMDCGGSLVGWGVDVSGTVNHNPDLNSITIPSDCPAGSYRIVSKMKNSSGNEIISGSVDFVIGDPDLTPSAPSVSNMTAKQNSPFSQQLPVGTGGDGTLSYTATNLPTGLSFITSTRTIQGTPSGSGASTVRYTVTDSDGDSDYVDFTITVNPDLTPSAPSVPGYTAKQNTPFSQQLPAGSGGDGTLTYGATGLPDGLNFITTTRTIAGTPTGTGQSTVRYTVTDSDGDSAYVDFTITVNQDLEPTAPSISAISARKGSLFTRQLPEGTGGDAPLSYNATNLPTGLTFITTTRTITGTPTTVESPTVTYTVRDVDGDEASTTFDFTISEDLMPGLPSISGYTAKEDSPFSQQLPEATGGDTPLSYTATGLPTGLTFITSTRTITGTPDSEEAPTVTYTVTDSDGDSDSVEFTITVNPNLTPSAPSVSPLTAKQNDPFSHQLPAGSGGDGTLSYSATGLPDGLLFTESTRTIAGTPTRHGPFTVRYTVTDSDGDSAYVEFTFTVNQDLEPTAPTISAISARKGSLFTRQLPEGSGGDAPLSYNAANLPTGLTFITTTRTITGTPTTEQTPTVTYTVRDVDGDQASTTFVFTIAEDLMPELPSISGYSARVDSPFSQQLPAATGGDTPLSYTATDLPTGLTFITSTRTITGTPTEVETPTVTYRVRDSDGDEDSTTFVFTVAEDLMPELPSISGYTAKEDSPFSQQLPEATGGDTPLSYTATGLPTGLTFITSTRTITGTPDSEEAPTVTYTVTDSDGDSDSVEFTFTVNPNLTPTAPSVSPLTAKQNDPFSHQLPEGSGGDGTLSYGATGLPDGLLFTESTRTIAGTPTRHGPFTVRYTVTDSDGDSAYVEFTITVNQDLEPTAPSISAISARKGSLITRQLPEGTGGDAPLSYSATNLPSGLSFITTTRTITGTPTTEQALTVTYTVRDSDGDEARTTFSFTVAADLMPTLPAISGYTAKVDSPFSQLLPAATGGDTPLSYSATNLPIGLTFITSTRTIQGTPTQVETPNVTYTVRDSDGDSDSVEFTITVNPDLTPSAPSVPGYSAKQNSPFSQQLPVGSGGDGTLSYGATGLPEGLSFITSTRTIAGTPTGTGPSTVRYTVTDSDGDSDYVDFTITVAADLTPSAPNVPAYTAKQNSPFTQQLPEGTGGDGTLSYAATGLPEGLSFIVTTRTITGTPTGTGPSTVRYTVTDSDGDSDFVEFNITVAEDLLPTLATISDTNAKLTKLFTLQLPAGSGGDGVLDYDATGLPPGLSFVKSTRTISGTPTTANKYEVTYTATDEDEDVVTRNFFIEVFAMPSLQVVPNFMATKDEVFTLELTAVSGGREPFDYDATPLPTGLSFVESSLTITGTPTQVEGIQVTFSVEDTDGDTASRQFQISVSEGDTEPTFAFEIPDYDLRVGSPFAVTLPGATGGNSPYTYTISELPDALVFITETRQLTGTPGASETGSHNITYTATDRDLDQISQTFELDIAADKTPSEPSINDMHLKVGSSLWAQLPAGTNGDPPYTYEITTLPSGLNFNRTTRILSGRPDSAGSMAVTYTVLDEDGDSAAKNFTINVYALPDLPGISDQSGMKDELFTLQLPAATGGRAPLRYAVTGLPSELQFNTSTLVITGTPAQVEVINVNYTVTDKDNDQDSVAFKITVTDLDQTQIANNNNNNGNNNNNNNNNGNSNSGGSQGGTDPQNTQPLTVVDVLGYSATVDELFTQQLPFASGGTLPYAYSVTPLPPGLDFILIKRTITGTPTVTGTTVVTYTVTDSGFVSASDAFTITVSGNGQGGSNQGSGNQGRGNQDGNNQGGGNQGNSQGGNNPGGGSQGNNQGGNKGGGNQGSGSNTKKNSGNSGNSNNRKKHVPPASSPPPSQQQHWSPSPVPVAVTLPSWLNVRRGPGLDYEVVTTVPQGTRGNIYGRDPADAWFQVQFADVSNLVWVCQNHTRVEGALDGVRFLSRWEIDIIPKSVDGPLATTTPAIMNVRAGPGLDYEILTTVPKGTEATIIGIGPYAEWYMVRLQNLSRPAWIYASLTTVQGFLGGVKQYTLAEVDGYTFADVDEPDTCTANPVAVTIPAILNVRRGPGTEYEILTTVVKGTRAEIVGIDPQDEWLLVELDSLVEPAWIYRELTTVVGSIAGVRRIGSGQASQPNTPTNVDRPFAVTFPALANVRVGPALTYAILKAVPQGTRASVLGLSPDENWYLVEIEGLSQLGWIREDLTVLVGNSNSVKRITAAEIAMLPVAIVDTPILNVRSGPGTGFGIVTTISQGTWAQIIGVNPGADWFQVELYGVTGQTWLYRNLTNLAGLLAGVTQLSSSTVAAAAEEDPALQATTILESASTVEAPPTQQITVNSITVEISLPSNGNIDLEVSWIDAGACTELYNIYYRSSAASTTYFSLETAVIASSAQSKSLSFLTLPDNSLISAWCGQQSSGRQIAEVQIDAGVEGTYSSLPSQQEADAVAAASGVELSN